MIVVQHERGGIRVRRVLRPRHGPVRVATGALVVNLHFEQHLQIIGGLSQQAEPRILLIQGARMTEQCRAGRELGADIPEKAVPLLHVERNPGGPGAVDRQIHAAIGAEIRIVRAQQLNVAVYPIEVGIARVDEDCATRRV
jgi:hypothetical protein